MASASACAVKRDGVCPAVRFDASPSGAWFANALPAGGLPVKKLPDDWLLADVLVDDVLFDDVLFGDVLVSEYGGLSAFELVGAIA